MLFYCKRMARCCVLRDKASLDVISRFRIVALCFLISLLGPTAAATEQAVTSGICIRRIRSAICSSVSSQNLKGLVTKERVRNSGSKSF